MGTDQRLLEKEAIVQVGMTWWDYAYDHSFHRKASLVLDLGDRLLFRPPYETSTNVGV